ncbi:MAG: hypothetical protein OEM85_16165 [Gammaproteobacteria bacterium]|nr:hypothetical protein [Gammaproteobacteria bacterium]MDH3374900.1 hypothetical protein [Gammaproteobacteria bacterium]MDH3409962.1 hypothetical protein [Gammaproteobacteria bacterium]
MLDRLEKLAVYLHGFRWEFLAFCAVVFVTLAILDIRGHEIVWPFMLSFMWLFGLAFFVETFQRSKRLEEAERMRDVGPRFMHEWIKTDAFWYLQALFFVFWFGFLAIITIRIIAS